MFNPADLLKLGAESFATAPAYVKIKDDRPMDEKSFDKKNAEKASGGSAGANIPGGSAVNNLKNKAEGAAKKAVSQVGSSGLLGALGGKIGGKLGMNELENDGYDKVFKVQFNPASLQISSMGGGEIVQKTDLTKKQGTSGKIEMGTTQPHVEMSVQLIFDGLSANYKAFASDLANFSTSNLINEATDLAGDLIGEKLLGGSAGISVQAAVEGFIAAVRNPYTRKIAFEWGDMYYRGEFKSVNATYTMFDSVGRPVRAKVSMSIYLQDTSVTDSDLGYWEMAYDQVFEDEKNKDGVNLSGGTGMNVAKSILNF